MIVLENVTKLYEEKNKEISVRAISNLNLTINDDDFVAITGKSGSGKSTLLNLIGTLVKPTEGTIWINNENVSNMSFNKLSEYRNLHMGYVYQSFMLENSFTAFENVEIPLLIAGIEKKERIERTEAVLEKVGLKERMKHKPNEMSGGERQRVCIARALVNNPEILLADEPTGNLDEKTGNEIFELMKELTKGKIFILVTHDLDLARKAKRQIVVSDGRICENVR